MACPAGYYGSNCNVKCPPGTYGVVCAGLCRPKCSDEKCHYAYGCLEDTTDKNRAQTSGEHPSSKRATKQEINTSRSLFQQTSTLLNTENPMVKNNLYRIYLLPVIGIVFFILVILIIAHVCQMFKEKRKETSNRIIQAQAIDEDDNLQLPMESVYHDIGDCLEMNQIPGDANQSRKSKRPTLPSRSRNSSCIFKSKDKKASLPINKPVPESAIEESSV